MKYITQDGVEKSLDSISDCAAAIRGNALTSESLVYDAASDRWIKASAHPDFSPLLKQTSKATDPSSPKALRVAAWAAWVTGLGVLPTVAGSLGSTGIAYELGYAIGMFLCLAVVGAIVLIFVKSPRGRMTLSLVLGVLLCFAEVGEVFKVQANRERLHASARHLEDALASKPEATKAAVTSAPAAGMDTSSTSPSSDTSSVLDVATDFIKANNQLALQFQTESSALNAETLLTPATLTSESRMNTASRRLSAWDTYLDSYVQRVNQLKGSFKSTMMSLHLSESQRTSVLEHFDSGAAKSNREMQRYIQVEHSLSHEIRAMYSFMGDRVGLVEVSGGKLVFPTSADADTYNAQFAEIKQLAAQEDEVLRAIQKLNEQGTASLQEAAKQAAAQ